MVHFNLAFKILLSLAFQIWNWMIKSFLILSFREALCSFRFRRCTRPAAMPNAASHQELLPGQASLLPSWRKNTASNPRGDVSSVVSTHQIGDVTCVAAPCSLQLGLGSFSTLANSALAHWLVIWASCCYAQ